MLCLLIAICRQTCNIPCFGVFIIALKDYHQSNQSPTGTFLLAGNEVNDQENDDVCLNRKDLNVHPDVWASMQQFSSRLLVAAGQSKLSMVMD